MSDYLGHELIVEIFTRLSCKSLIRFRSLSKSWYACIGSPDFIRKHTSRSRQKLLLLRHRSRGQNEKFEFEGFYTIHPEDQFPLCPTSGYIGVTKVQFPIEHSTIVGSCNGILCLHDDLFYKHGFSLWNLSIRHKLTLPDCPQRSYSELNSGFGFDPVTDDYKIVIIPGELKGNLESSFVYTMKTNSWCTIASHMPSYHSVIITKACFVSGALHWVVNDHGDNSRFLLTFVLSSHVFGSIALPEPYPTIAMTTIQGSLAMITEDSSDDDYWIWVRRDASWCVVSKLKVPGGLTGVLQLSTDGDLLLGTICGYCVYNSNTTWEARLRLANFNDAFFLMDVVQCRESLQLLDSGTPCEVEGNITQLLQRMNDSFHDTHMTGGSKFYFHDLNFIFDHRKS